MWLSAVHISNRGAPYTRLEPLLDIPLVSCSGLNARTGRESAAMLPWHCFDITVSHNPENKLRMALHSYKIYPPHPGDAIPTHHSKKSR